MRPSAPAPGVGAGDPPSCRPGLPRFPKLPPTASLTARSTSLAQQLACPPLPAGLGPALPSGRLSTGIQPEEWGRETTAAWAQRPWAGSSLCPAHPAGGFQPQVTKGWGHCPTASPTLLGPLAGPFPSPPPTAATGEHCQAQAQAQGGDGALPTRWTLLSSIYMFLLPPPMVAAKTQGPGRKLCPKSPRKYQHQSLGRWNLLTKPVMGQPAPDLPPPWQTGWGQQVALCCLQSLGTAGALSDLQITLSPVHSTQQSLSQQASDYKLNRHALVHLQCG